MIKYFLKNKVKKEMKNSKFIVFSGGVFLGYLSYKMIKRRKNIKKYEMQLEKYEQEEMKRQIDEFNSRRLTSNSNPKEMVNYIDSIEEDKENITISDENLDNHYDDYDVYLK